MTWKPRKRASHLRAHIQELNLSLPGLPSFKDKSSHRRGSITEFSTKFGNVYFDPTKKLYFPRGILGFENCHSFILTSLPEEMQKDQFFLLLNQEDTDLAFVVFPLDKINGLIDQADLKEAADLYHISFVDSLFLALISIRCNENEINATMNIRAPIIINTSSLLGWQHVLGNDGYKIRHPIFLPTKK